MAAETADPGPILPFTQFVLDNGLTVIVRLPAGVAREPAAEAAAGGLAAGPRG